MKKITVVCLLLALILSLSACVTTMPDVEELMPETPVETPDETPEEEIVEDEIPGILTYFTAPDLEGNAVDESLLSGKKLTMVNIWATYCGPCLNEMPDLGELAAEYAEKDVQIMGLVTDVLNSDGTFNEEQVSLAQEIVETTGANYVHIIPSVDFYGILSQVSAVPTTFFVDENGHQVGSAVVGSKSKADWAALIDELLEEVK